jgi:arsenate reductase (thioredoxin)
VTGAERRKRVLFICVENCNRSQMAEAFARLHGRPGQVEAYSAGCRPAACVHPKAITAMREIGYDMQQHYTKGLSYVPDLQFDAVVTMGCADLCPDLRATVKEDWGIHCHKAMPSERFRTVRDQIGEKVKDLLARLAVAPDGITVCGWER